MNTNTSALLNFQIKNGFKKMGLQGCNALAKNLITAFCFSTRINKELNCV